MQCLLYVSVCLCVCVCVSVCALKRRHSFSSVYGETGSGFFQQTTDSRAAGDGDVNFMEVRFSSVFPSWMKVFVALVLALCVASCSLSPPPLSLFPLSLSLFVLSSCSKWL